jgi:hypothetical protein
MKDKQYQILHDIIDKIGTTNDSKELSSFLSSKYDIDAISEFIIEICLGSNLEPLTAEEIQLYNDQIKYLPAKVLDEKTNKLTDKIHVQSYMASLYHLLSRKYNEVIKSDPELAKELILRISKIFS